MRRRRREREDDFRRSQRLAANLLMFDEAERTCAGEGGGRPSTIEAASGAGTSTREGECAAWERGGALAVQDQNQLRAWAADTARALSGEDSALVRELLLHHAGAGGEDEQARHNYAANELLDDQRDEMWALQ